MSKQTGKTRLITNKMCPFAQKAWIALECASVDYQLEQISLYGANGKPSWFLQLNPAGTVPVVVVEAATTSGENDGGTTAKRTSANAVFPDSDLILNQFEKQQPVSIPYQTYIGATSPEEERRIKEWRRRINHMLPIGKKAVLSSSSPSAALKPLQPLLQEMNDAVMGPYLVGDRLTTADCHALPFLWRLHQEFKCFKDYDKLQQWLETCQQRSEIRKTLVASWWWWW